jgi:hypothetical protein
MQWRQITAGRILHAKNCKFTAIIKASECQTNRQKVQKGAIDGFLHDPRASLVIRDIAEDAAQALTGSLSEIDGEPRHNYIRTVATLIFQNI